MCSIIFLHIRALVWLDAGPARENFIFPEIISSLIFHSQQISHVSSHNYIFLHYLTDEQLPYTDELPHDTRYYVRDASGSQIC